METCSYLSLLRLQAAAWLEVSAAFSGLQWHFGPILREVRPLFGVRVDSGPVLRLVFFLTCLGIPHGSNAQAAFDLLLLAAAAAAEHKTLLCLAAANRARRPKLERSLKSRRSRSVGSTVARARRFAAAATSLRSATSSAAP